MSTAVALESCRSATTWGDATETPRDRAAEQLRALLDQYERPLYGFLVNLVGPHDAADGTQETFLRAYEHLRRGQSVTKGWLYTVARHLALDQLRHSRRTRTHFEVLEEMPQPPPPDRADLVRRTLARLVPEEIEVLYLFNVDGFTTEQIAPILGISGAAVRQRLCRARARFRMNWCQLVGEDG
jgi:RNA polymerase sigma-70 factor (ECF subfamily)